MYFRAFNFRTSQAVRKNFNNEMFAIYGSLVGHNNDIFVVETSEILVGVKYNNCVGRLLFHTSSKGHFKVWHHVYVQV